MAAIVLMLIWACAAGITTTASRMTWAFARDNGLPASKWLAKVDSRTKVPVIACLVVTTIAALLTLIYIGSSVAFNDVISLTITGFYGSYLLPASLLLYHRAKGNILPYSATPPTQSSPSDAKIANPANIGTADPEPNLEKKSSRSREASPSSEHDIRRGTVVANARLIWGPWHLPGLLGTLNNLYACIYMVFVIFW